MVVVVFLYEPALRPPEKLAEAAPATLAPTEETVSCVVRMAEEAVSATVPLSFLATCCCEDIVCLCGWEVRRYWDTGVWVVGTRFQGLEMLGSFPYLLKYYVGLMLMLQSRCKGVTAIVSAGLL